MPQYTFSSQFTTDFEYSQAESCGNHNLCILFLHGLCSDPWGRKGDSIKAYAQEKGIGFCRFEYAGHGSDKANYEKADLDVWKAQVLEVMEHIIKEEQILFVGSSIGGWLSILGALACPKRAAGIIGLAAAADFSKDLYNYALTDSQKEELEKIGKTSVGTADFSYLFTKNFFTVAEKHFVLQRNSFGLPGAFAAGNERRLH